MTFDSVKEARRWLELVELARAGRIQYLRRQVRFRLSVNGVKVCAFVADFVYIKQGLQVVEDVKSEWTRKLPVYRLKRKLMLAVYSVEVKET